MCLFFHVLLFFMHIERRGSCCMWNISTVEDVWWLVVCVCYGYGNWGVRIFPCMCTKFCWLAFCSMCVVGVMWVLFFAD